MTRIEHANITVPDIDAAIAFLKVVAPDFEVRKDATDPRGYRWVHIGNDDHYFALEAPHDPAGKSQIPLPTYQNYGVNHIALIVSNIREIEKQLIAGGYKPSIATPEEKFRKRIYYFDSAGFEWELVEYGSDDPSEKYLYE